MKPAALLALLALVACSAPVAPGPAATSPSVSGWTPEVLSDGTYLPDYSYAGYRWGEEPLPTPTATVIDATEYGVVADDGLDDLSGLRRAIDVASEVDGWVVVQLPPGEVEIQNLVFIERGQLVLRGAGSGQGGTVLSIPVPMREMSHPRVLRELNDYLVENDKTVSTGEYFTPYSWTGGVIWTRAPEGTAPASNDPIAGAASGTRGAHTFTVESVGALAVGEVVRLGWFSREGADGPFLQHLYGVSEGLDGSRLWENPEEPLITQEVTIDAIDGRTVTVHEPLLHDLRPEWSAVLAPETRLENVGIEGMHIRFPETEFVAHHLEQGYNAIYLTDLRDGWVRDVTFTNADSGILSDRCANLTLTGIVVQGRTAHYGVHLGDVQRALLTDFETTAWSYHPVSFNTGARQSVITNGRVVSPQLDQHRGANHSNLYDDLDIVEPGDELRVLTHGGAGYWGPPHGVANTFWNVRLEVENPDAFTAPVTLDGIRARSIARVVGFTANVPIEIEYDGAVIEGTNRPGIAIPSLYQYQRARRATR